MVLKYSNKPQITYGSERASPSWHSRFPANARPMGIAPITATWPIKLYEPTGKPRWGIHHLGGWREIDYQLDADGKKRVRMNGRLIANPIAWSSS